MNVMYASEAAKLCGGKLYGTDSAISRIWRVDSREVSYGDAFVALKGERTDGHLYVHQAIDKGAQLVLVQESRVKELELDSADYVGITVIAVDDTFKALTSIAHEYFKQVSPQVIGITGSVGKTTTRELVVAALSKKYKIHSAIKSFNTSIGCSLVVLSMPRDTEMLVLEFGTNHFGEIDEMVCLFPPETAMITEVAAAHLSGFGSISGVLKAKMEICSNDTKLLVYNADNVLLKEAITAREELHKLIGVGHSDVADVRIKDCKISLNEKGAKIFVAYKIGEEDFMCESNLFGSQHAYNIGFALATAQYYGVDDEDIKQAFAEFKAIKGRGVCKKLGNGSWIIDEAYNANPSSMRAAIENMYEVADKRKKIAVLAGMRELGRDSDYWHKEILLLCKKCDRIFLLGNEWNSAELSTNAQLYSNFEELTEAVLRSELSDSIILIKGSNSYGLKRLIAVMTEV